MLEKVRHVQRRCRKEGDKIKILVSHKSATKKRGLWISFLKKRFLKGGTYQISREKDNKKK